MDCLHSVGALYKQCFTLDYRHLSKHYYFYFYFIFNIIITPIRILFLESVHIQMSIYFYILLLLFRIIFLSVNYHVFLCEAL